MGSRDGLMAAKVTQHVCACVTGHMGVAPRLFRLTNPQLTLESDLLPTPTQAICVSSGLHPAKYNLPEFISYATNRGELEVSFYGTRARRFVGRSESSDGIRRINGRAGGASWTTSTIVRSDTCRRPMFTNRSRDVL